MRWVWGWIQETVTLGRQAGLIPDLEEVHRVGEHRGSYSTQMGHQKRKKQD